mgnify:FL=1|tara:strand:+ start:276 stop:614 length:339 start_codon:yes stop_codon:yes gene_type:complete
MAVKDVAGTQHSFVERTRTIERVVKNETITTLLKHVGGTANAIYEATGSQGEALSTHFMVASQSNVESLNSFSGSLSDGGAYNAKGLVTGTLYPISLSYVSASTHAQVDLFR